MAALLSNDISPILNSGFTATWKQENSEISRNFPFAYCTAFAFPKMAHYLERIVSRFEFGDVHPLAIDVVFINVTAINGNTLVPVIGALVPEIARPLKLRAPRLASSRTANRGCKCKRNEIGPNERVSRAHGGKMIHHERYRDFYLAWIPGMH